MNPLKLTPPTALPSSKMKNNSSIIEINQFQASEMCSNPMVTLQMAIYDLEEDKKSLTKQVQFYQNKMRTINEIEAQNQIIKLQATNLKEELSHIKSKLENEIKQTKHLKNIIAELQNAIQKDCKQKTIGKFGHHQSAQLSQQISVYRKHAQQTYENMIKYLQGLQKKSAQAYSKQIQVLNNRVSQLMSQNKELRQFIKVDANISQLDCDTTLKGKLQNFNSSIQSSKGKCKNSSCLNYQRYIAKLIKHLISQNKIKNQIQNLKAHISITVQHFQKNYNNLQKLYKKQEGAPKKIQDSKKTSKSRSKSREKPSNKHK